MRINRSPQSSPLTRPTLLVKIFLLGITRTILSLGLAFLPTAASAQSFQPALPGYHYSFPHDYFNHPDFQTEWWYYTGNLQTPDGHRFGFELTFFRQAVARASTKKDNDRKISDTENVNATKKSAWDVHDLYLAHLALSDLTGGRFYHLERTNRPGPGIAGVDESTRRIWNGNWQIQWQNSDQLLQAVAENFQLKFTLHSEKPPVIHGENGVSQKSPGEGHASHYLSLTRLDTKGTITLNNENFPVTGVAWMDHEFFTQQLSTDQVGWDWFSLQLTDHSELMLFHIRRQDGSIDPYSAGTYIDPQGHSAHLTNSDFTLQPITDQFPSNQSSIDRSAANRYQSPTSAASYPIHWKITVPKLNLDLEATTPLPSQELTGNSDITPTYWEGAITLRGTRTDARIAGMGYLEMTGYAKRPASR
jgi:predicted secreted hydrolase